MILNVAGFNIDKSLIDSLGSKTATPEVISAAYARISRSSKQVDQLRAESLAEIDKARSSNESIIYEMGHSSVAEHAVFNLDIIDISRLLTDTVQRSRIASFTEKSQRYVTFGNSYVIPAELNKYPKLKKQYKALMKSLFAEYEACFRALDNHYKETRPELKPRDRETLAKEDARYILPLATQTQMGITINARSLENLLRRLAKNPTAEAAELGNLIYSKVACIAPSLIRYTQDDGYSGRIDLERVGFTSFLQQELPWLAELDLEARVKVLNSPQAADDSILSAIIYQQGELNWSDTKETVARLPKLVKQQLWKQVFQNMKAWHKPPRAFEMVDFGFELSMSESCWAQFKRHRYCSILRKGGNSPFCKFPLAIKLINRTETWEKILSDVNDVAFNLPPKISFLAPYLRVNSSMLTVYVKMNLREIYHFVRLRSDEHAQWEIRELSQLMADSVRSVCPQAGSLLCGKSEFRF
ncbi:MAG: FAD-dependent thymidylate synthase [Candidatus Cloacimonetes bacterium]|nr:FAD-dependent thymidylate synthase [Candidatus Cloacimonadota bacterium]